MEDNHKDGALTSEKLTGLKKKAPKEVAGGLPAVLSSMKHVLPEVGLIRGNKVLLALNQKGGIDCPGCAWPDPDDERSGVAEYCENGAKAIAEEATAKKVTAAFFKKHSVAELAQWSDYELGKTGRLAQPMYLPKGSKYYQAISWDEAFQLTASKLTGLASPDEAVFYTSGRTSNEAAFLYQLFVRAYGTNNLPDCSNMCHESSGVALGETLGIGKGSVTLDDFYEAEVIMIMGQNPGTNHPRMLTALQEAKRNGATIISVNPLKETGLKAFSHPQEVSGILGASTPLTDHYLQVRINGDHALLQILAKLLLQADEANQGKVLDHDFIAKHTADYEAYVSHLKKIDVDSLLPHCGLELDQIRVVADILARNEKIIVCWAMGLTQHKNAVDTLKEIVNILLMKGSIGKPGAGTCPVRGHSNVQGDRTMGIFEKPSTQLLDKLEQNFKIDAPRQHGYDVVDSIKAMHEGKVGVFFAMGGNFLSATPDTSFTAAALRKCRLTVHVSTKLNRSHLVHGEEALILPCLGRTDVDLQNGAAQFVSVENSMGIVHSSRGSLKPVSDQLLSEPDIVCRLAAATLPDSRIHWDHYRQDYDTIRDAIEETIDGFDNYNEKVRQPAGFYLPNCAREQNFHEGTQKAPFSVSTLAPIDIPDGEFLMMTVRSHDQYNTTIYGLDDRYRGILNERRVVMINASDMAAQGLKEGQLVDLVNSDENRQRVAPKFIVVSYDIPPKCIATYFPEANVLVPINHVALKSNTPASKSVLVSIRPHKNL